MVLRLGGHAVAAGDLADFDAALVGGVLLDQLADQPLNHVLGRALALPGQPLLFGRQIDDRLLDGRFRLGRSSLRCGRRIRVLSNGFLGFRSKLRLRLCGRFRLGVDELRSLLAGLVLVCGLFGGKLQRLIGEERGELVQRDRFFGGVDYGFEFG